MLQRGGQVVINLLANVQHKTIEPLIKATIVPGTHVYTDEYSMYARLPSWGYGHKSVNHGRGELARDDDGDGVCEVHVNTMEGFWSLLRSWLRPHRGISQEKLPVYLGFSSSCTTSASEAKRCFLRSLSSLSRKTLESNKSAMDYHHQAGGKAETLHVNEAKSRKPRREPSWSRWYTCSVREA
jgi:transposase-like protein